MESAETMLRVERGQIGKEELAALAAVLLTLRASGQAEPEPEATPGWNWWTSPNSYVSPTGWW